jgi:LysR family transcriptional regulator, low CO2-responsive transcriptional regulator
MLNLYKLEIFNAVAMEGSFSRAAERMLLSQPAVSQHIRDLEASLHTKLFLRGSRGVKLTPAGETLLDYTRCILRLLGEAENALLQQKDLENASISIGATPGVGLNLLPAWIQEYQKRYTRAKIKLKTETTSVIVREILAGRLEISFIEGELEEKPPLRTFHLREIDMFIMVGPKHPWAKKKLVKVSSLQGVPFITRPPGSHSRIWIDRFFEEQRVFPEIIAEFDRPEAIIAAVHSGMGITVLPDWGVEQSIDSQLIRLRLEEVSLRRTLKLVWSENHPIKPTAKAFLSLLLEEFPLLVELTDDSAYLDDLVPQINNYRASLRCKNDSEA